MQPARRFADARTWPRPLAVPALLLAIVILFYWKITLTNQYSWMNSPDFAYQVLPWYQFEASEFHHGRFPLWDPFEWGGHTLIGQAQPGTAYPPNWVLFALPLKNGFIRRDFMHWYYALIHYMGALFCYLLCRDLKRSRAASLVAGVIFGLGGWMGSTDWPQMLNGAVWAPLVFLFLLRAVRGERPVRNAGLSGAFLGVAFLSGHHQVPIFTALAACGVWVWALARDWRKLAAALLLFAVMAGLVGAFQSLPALEYGKEAIRWVGAKDPVGWKDKVPYYVHGKYALSPVSVLGAVIPGMHDNSNSFIGLVAISLALAALAVCWRELPVRILLGVAIGGLLFALAPYTIFHGMIYTLSPMVEKARNASMAVFIFHFGIAALAAYGVDAVSGTEASRFTRRLSFGLLGFAAVLWGVVLVMQLNGKGLAHQEVALVPLTAVLLAALFAGRRGGHISPGAAAGLLAALALFEFGMTSSQLNWHHRDDPDSLLAKLTADRDVADYLRAQPGHPRVEIDADQVPYNFGDWYGIEYFGSYTASIPANITRVQGNSHARMLFAVRYAVGRKPSRADQIDVFTGANGLKVYQNPEAFPRAWSVHATIRARDTEDADRYLDGPLAELRRAAVLTGETPALDTCAAPDEVRLAEHIPNRLAIDAIMACRGMVIASEAFYPGWDATVDGKPARIYDAYDSLRGVVVPAGRHRIEMRYRPRSVYAGGAATFVGLLLACALGFYRKQSVV